MVIPRTRLRLAAGVVAVLASAAVLAAVTPPSADAAPAAAAQHPWDADNLSPASRTVAPVRVTRTTGSVVGAKGAIGTGSTTLRGAGTSVTYDFGEEVGGLVSLHFPATTRTGQELGLAFTESSQYIGTTSDASNGGSGPDGAVYADVAADSTWTVPKAQLRGGFRYLTVFMQSADAVTFDHVSLAITFDPTATDLRDYANHFYSSDPLLNRIWYAGAYTAQTNTIAPTTGRVWGPPSQGWDNSGTVGTGDTVLVDGAKRDRTVWPGDLGVSVPTEYASLGDVTPTRNALTTLFDHQQPTGELPFAGPEVDFYGSDTYHLWTLIGTANYVQYSHDTAWFAGEWADYRKAVAFSLGKVGTDGLLSVTGTADWARSGQGGENIAANALLYQVLVTGSQLATLSGDPADATAWTDRAATLKAAANAVLWDDAAGQYRDNPTSTLHPQDGNSLAVWYGLAPADRASRVSAALTGNWNAYGATTPEKDGEIGTFPGSMEVAAHLQAGDATTALALIRREWGYMLNSPLGTGSTFWEGYLANGQFGYGGQYMSASHGWATGPTSALTFYVLGIRPTTIDGGYDVAPEPGDLSSTQGSLATPFGTIAVDWQHDAKARTFTELVNAPRGAVTRILVPTFGATTQVTVNGRTVWDGTKGLAYGAHVEGTNVVLTGAPTSKVTVHSTQIGRVPTTLAVSAPASSGTPLRAGQSATIPVTVTAQGDVVVRGTVTATVPAGWTTTPAAFTVDPRNGPARTTVDVAVQPPPGVSGGDEPVALTATAGAVTATASTDVLVFGAWASGVTATASSAHAPNVYQGQTRTYDATNAVDGNDATFWNDDTPGAFPDTLTVTAPAAVDLDGVGFESLVDGVPTDFTVQTWDGTAWVTQATVTGNAAVTRWIPFAAPVSTTRVQVVVTASQTQNGNYTRIAELTP